MNYLQIHQSVCHMYMCNSLYYSHLSKRISLTRHSRFKHEMRRMRCYQHSVTTYTVTARVHLFFLFCFVLVASTFIYKHIQNTLNAMNQHTDLSNGVKHVLRCCTHSNSQLVCVSLLFFNHDIGYVFVEA